MCFQIYSSGNGMNFIIVTDSFPVVSSLSTQGLLSVSADEPAQVGSPATCTK